MPISRLFIPKDAPRAPMLAAFLILLGALAVVVAIRLPYGLWGTVSRRFGLRLFNVGYTVRGLDKQP